MKAFVKLLDIAVGLIGAILILWGFVTGVIGIGPDTVPMRWRWIGIGFGAVGCLYWIPYRRIISNKIWMFAYLLGVSLPVLFILLSFLHEMNTGLDKDAIVTAMAVIGILSLAPATLVLRLKLEDNTKRQADVQQDRTK